MIYIKTDKAGELNRCMQNNPLTIDQLRHLINKGEAKDPLVFLEAIMNGQDPRRLSSVYELIMEIDSFTNGEITKGDWNELVDHVSTKFKYYPVSISESINAAKTLSEYLHAKRKHLEINGDINSKADPNSNPLTEEEIMLFKEKFNDEF